LIEREREVLKEKEGRKEETYPRPNVMFTDGEFKTGKGGIKREKRTPSR